MNTEKQLKKLFDYQRFEKNNNLEKLIRESESRYSIALSDEDLELVYAAGEIKSGTEYEPALNSFSTEISDENNGLGGELGDQDPGFKIPQGLCTYCLGQNQRGNTVPECSDYANKNKKTECANCPARF